MRALRERLPSTITVKGDELGLQLQLVFHDQVIADIVTSDDEISWILVHLVGVADDTGSRVGDPFERVATQVAFCAERVMDHHVLRCGRWPVENWVRVDRPVRDDPSVTLGPKDVAAIRGGRIEAIMVLLD